MLTLAEERQTFLAQFPTCSFPIKLMWSLDKVFDRERWLAVYGEFPDMKLFPLMMAEISGHAWPMGKARQSVDPNKDSESSESEAKKSDSKRPSKDFPNPEKLAVFIASKKQFGVSHQINNRLPILSPESTNKAFRGAAFFLYPQALSALPLPPAVAGINTHASSERVDSFMDARSKYLAVLGAEADSKLSRAPWVLLPEPWTEQDKKDFGDSFFPADPLTGVHLTPEAVEAMVAHWRQAQVFPSSSEIHKRIDDWVKSLYDIRDHLMEFGRKYGLASQATVVAVETKIAPWLAQLLFAWDDQGDIALTPLPSDSLIAGLSKAIDGDPRRASTQKYLAAELPCSEWSAYYKNVQNESAHARASVSVLMALAGPTEKSAKLGILKQKTAYQEDTHEAWGRQLDTWLWDRRDKKHDAWFGHFVSAQAVLFLEGAMESQRSDRRRAAEINKIEKVIQKDLQAMMEIWTDFLAEHELEWSDIVSASQSLDPRILAIERHLWSKKDEEGHTRHEVSSGAYRAGLARQWEHIDLLVRSVP